MTAQRHSTPITNHLMTIDTRFEYINIQEIKNRRFMLNTRTGILLLGDEKYGKTFLGSHAEEFHSSGATGSYDDYLRGWIGSGGNYRSGIIHFAPAIEKPTFDQGFDALKMFSQLEGICARTIVRGFYGGWEEKIGSLLPSSFK